MRNSHSLKKWLVYSFNCEWLIYADCHIWQLYIYTSLSVLSYYFDCKVFLSFTPFYFIRMSFLLLNCRHESRDKIQLQPWGLEENPSRLDLPCDSLSKAPLEALETAYWHRRSRLPCCRSWVHSTDLIVKVFVGWDPRAFWECCTRLS